MVYPKILIISSDLSFDLGSGGSLLNLRLQCSLDDVPSLWPESGGGKTKGMQQRRRQLMDSWSSFKAVIESPSTAEESTESLFKRQQQLQSSPSVGGRQRRQQSLVREMPPVLTGSTTDIPFVCRLENLRNTTFKCAPVTAAYRHLGGRNSVSKDWLSSFHVHQVK